MKLPMILLWKAMVFQVGVHGLQAHPQKFWFAENLGKKGSNVVWLEKMAPKVCIKIHEDLFFEVTPKRGLHDFCGWKYIGRSCTKSFSGKFGEIRGKSFAPQTFACSYTYDEKVPLPRCPSLERVEGKMPSPCLHSPASLCIFFYTHSL